MRLKRHLRFFGCNHRVTVSGKEPHRVDESGIFFNVETDCFELWLFWPGCDKWELVWHVPRERLLGRCLDDLDFDFRRNRKTESFADLFNKMWRAAERKTKKPWKEPRKQAGVSRAETSFF